MKQLSIVMISMNEENAIKKVLDDITASYPDCEIVIVDSSTDKTAEIAIQYKNVKLIKQFPPAGYGNALITALKKASKNIIVTLDCDNTYPVKYIKTLYQKIELENYDLVDGSRLKFKPKNMPLINYLANVFFGLIATILFGIKILDLHSGMRAYKKDYINSLKWRPDGAAFPVELILMALKHKKKLFIDYIEYNERLGISKMQPINSAYWTIKRILQVKFS